MQISDSIKGLINFKSLMNIKSYFPKLDLDQTKSNKSHKSLWDDKIKFNQNETNLCQNIIKNIEIDIFEVADKSVNAFTVPGVGSINDLKDDSGKYYLEGINYLSKNPLEFTIDSKTNKINFNNNKTFKILIFVNSGLIKKLKDPQDRLAVYLHEVGHWVYVTDIIKSKSFQNYLNISSAAAIPATYIGIADKQFLAPIFIYILTIILTYLTSLKTVQSEHDADNFVKQCGYGNNLANALSVMEYNKSLSKLDISTYYSKIDVILNKIQMALFVNSHPDTKNRIDRLIKEDTNTDYKTIIISDLLKLFTDLLAYLKTINIDIQDMGIFKL